MEHHHSNKGEFLKCLSEFFKRDLVSIPIVKKYPHATITQRCGLKAATIELDTAAYPNIEYVAGTRLSIYPLNPPAHVHSIMEHLIDDVSQHSSGSTTSTGTTTGTSNTATNGGQQHQPHYSHQVMVGNWAKFAQLTGKDCLRLALTYLFDIMTAPSRELIRLLADNCQMKEQKKRLIAIGQSNESWEKWLCSSHRTLKSLFEEYNSCKLSAGKLLNELNLQQPRQYSISNIKSSKRFRTEIIVVQHKYSLSQIELNLRQLRDRETYEQTVSPGSPPQPSQRSKGSKSIPKERPAAASSSISPLKSTASTTSTAAKQHQGPESGPPRSPTRPASAPKQQQQQQRQPPALGRGSRGSKGSQRSIRSTASFASSPITTHQVKRVSSFSGPLMSAYANASSGSSQGAIRSTTGSEHSKSSKLSLLSVLQSHDRALKSNLGGTNTLAAGKFEGLCSNYLLNLNSSDQILCEFIENPRFTLKGNRERPIMMIGQDVGMIAFRAFLQQRHLEHDRAQVFYSTFKDLEPKKFGDMQMVCLTGHKGHIEELFKHEIQTALSCKILSSVTNINRRHFLSLLTAATTKSQLVLSQLQQQPNASSSTATTTSTAAKSTLQQPDLQQSQLNQQNLLINSKELLELGDKIYRLLVENNGCLYTCCDPHMTQAIEILTFESIARNNHQLTRERLMKLLPKWKGSDTEAQAQPDDTAAGCFTLENTYERAQIVQEIYDSSI